ncbi:hypothetical protein [Bradyrhizobium erythrophlei]|uniref:Uncharacterized protein n=1 Tax=Bradyrhizobium erythrophlei TaxID=1437360 RepID=A0A1M5NEZ3_9BRAD|nr:hypothetical protein [Bradyrhizobium erythrophlei]SHG88081.1 hypothetical protein SAMN05443248_2968 [Bradyrhizobium erythrophlei]
MGANFETMTLDGKLDREAVKQKFAEAQDQDRYENGHSYSGGFGMASGLMFVAGDEFADAKSANDYLDANCRKWEEARAVRFKRGDKTHWMIGAICAS